MVEIIPKEVQDSPKEVSLSFYFIISLLIFSIGCYFVLNNLSNKAEEDLNFLKSGLTEMMTPEKKDLERDLLFLENKINNFSFLAEKHLQSSESFELFEKITHPQVWFYKFSLSSDKQKLQVSGETQSFETLGQQIFIFEDEALITKINLEDISINSDGKIDFNLILYLDSEIFKPDFSEIEPDVLEIKPDVLEIEPDVLEIEPDVLEAETDILEIKPDTL